MTDLGIWSSLDKRFLNSFKLAACSVHQENPGEEIKPDVFHEMRLDYFAPLVRRREARALASPPAPPVKKTTLPVTFTCATHSVIGETGPS